MDLLKKQQLLLAILLLTNLSTFASHLMGGNLEYTFLGQNKYLIELHLYRDCSGIDMFSYNSIQVENSCNSYSIPLKYTYPNGKNITPVCVADSALTSCYGGSLIGVQEYVYFDTITLLNNCSDTKISYGACCRNVSTNLQNSINADFYIEMEIDSVAFGGNKSPEFVSDPIPFVCLNQPVNYNVGAIDSDGDSLVYKLISPYKNSNDTIPFVFGKSSLNPFGTSSSFQFDSLTGNLYFIPTQIGLFDIAVLVEEYDRITGILKGTALKDIQFVVNNCSNLSPYVDANGITNVTGGATLIDSNSIRVCNGTSFGFDVLFYDSNATDIVSIQHSVIQSLGGNASFTVQSGNPATLHVDWTPTIEGSYSIVVTAKDDACSIYGSTNFSLTIEVDKTTMAGIDQTICQGVQSANLEATGGSSFTWSVVSGDPILLGTNFSCINCKDPIASPTITTTYEVVSNFSGVCSNKDSVTVFVAPNFNMSMAGGGTICSGGSTALQANVFPSGNYTYNWDNPQDLDNAQSFSPIASPFRTKQYTVTVSNAFGCKKKDSIVVTTTGAFPRNGRIVGDSVLCNGMPLNLSLESGAIDFSECAPMNYNCLANNIDYTITNQSGGWSNSIVLPSLFASTYKSAQHQLLYTASELHALGMVDGGLINSISFDVAQINGIDQFSNFRVKAGCTHHEDLNHNSIIQTQEVFSASTYHVNQGWTVIQFDTPYEWDGTSNLVIEICFTNQTSNYGTNVNYQQGLTLNKTVRGTYSNNNSVCGNSGYIVFSNKRPKTKFNVCGSDFSGKLMYDWRRDGINVTLSTAPNYFTIPGQTEDYMLIISDSSGLCTDTIRKRVNLVSKYDPSFSIGLSDSVCVHQTAAELIPATPGGLWSGNGVFPIGGKYYVSPNSLGVGSHSITYTISGACANDTTINYSIIPTPSLDIIAPDYYCKGGAPFALTASTLGGVFKVNGQVVPNNTIDPSNLQTGLNTIYYDVNQVCPRSDTHAITLFHEYQFSSPDSLKICDNDTVILSDSVQITQGGWNQFNFIGQGIIDKSLGEFLGANVPLGGHLCYFEISDKNGFCAKADSIFLEVNKTDYLSLTNDQFYTNQTNEVLNTNFPMSLANYTNDPLNAGHIRIHFKADGSFNPSLYPKGEWLMSFNYTNQYGCTGYSTDTIHIDWPVGMNETNTDEINVYPNPFLEYLVLDFKSVKNIPQSIEIKDVQGKVVYSTATINSQKWRVDSSKWSSGVYFIRFTVYDNIKTYKLVKY